MDKRNKNLNIRISDAEYEALSKLSVDANMSISELIRDHIGKVNIRNRNDEKQRTMMLNRINANLNMIARWANTHQKNTDKIEVLAHLVAIEYKIKELIK